MEIFAIEMIEAFLVPAGQFAFTFGIGCFLIRAFIDAALNGRFRI